MLRKLALCAMVVLVAVTARISEAQITLQALTTFSGDGWLSPTEAGGTLAVANQVRSMGFDPSTSTLLIPSGANTVQRINATTGVLGATFNNTGVTGGAVQINTVAATTDGVIYASNLTSNTGPSPFKVYRWTSDSSPPTVAYQGDAEIPNVRVGDNIAVLGPDATGVLGFGYGAGVTSGTFVGVGSNGFATLPTGASVSATAVTFASPTAPAVGAFRLGMAFVSDSSVIGTQNSALLPNATFAGSSATLVSNPTLTNGGSQRGVGYGEAYGVPLLATIDTVSNAVRLYDASDLAAPALLSTLNLTSGSPVSNGNGTAQVLFGTLGGQPVLYALNSNNGIQAFQIVPEPSTLGMLGIAATAAAFAGWRRRRPGC